jgi:formylmethanofuran dehydrogenase subunit C
MDRNMIVGQLMQRGKCFIEHSLARRMGRAEIKGGAIIIVPV